MSELKPYIGPHPTDHTLTEYYFKSEADKVIAEKDEEIYNIKYSRDEWAKDCNQKDKEIAELKSQKAQAEDDCAYWKMSEGNAVNAMHETEEYAMQLYNELRHQKFKRCLAMAERCKYRMYYLAAVVEQEASKIIPLKAQIQWYQKRENRMYYWKNRWLELAERFKDEEAK